MESADTAASIQTGFRSGIEARMERAVEKVLARMRRAVTALEGAGIPCAVVGGNAVAAWVATVDESAVRNTQDVDILIARPDFETAKQAMESAGFSFRHVFGVDMFLDGPGAKAKDAVHIVFAGEKVKPEYDLAAPGLDGVVRLGETVPCIALDDLIRMKLTSFRRKDQVHLQDMIGVGLADASMLPGLPPPLAARLKELLDDPES